MGPPLVVLNNFSGAEHLKLAASMLQNLFPSINVQTTKLSSCQVRPAKEGGRRAGAAARGAWHWLLPNPGAVPRMRLTAKPRR